MLERASSLKTGRSERDRTASRARRARYKREAVKSTSGKELGVARLFDAHTWVHLSDD